MRSSYRPEDVTLLLKDITGLVEPLPESVREKRIQSGTHYCEMLPLEYEPTEEYLQTYHHAVGNFSLVTAKAVLSLSRAVIKAKGNGAVLVSLARAGTPVGILLKRCIKQFFSLDVPHYSISIIRGRGIDRNALDHIISLHGKQGIQFVDGWTGKRIQTWCPLSCR